MHERKMKEILKFYLALIKCYLMTVGLWFVWSKGRVTLILCYRSQCTGPLEQKNHFWTSLLYLPNKCLMFILLLSCGMRLYNSVLNKDPLCLFNQSYGSTELKDAFVFLGVLIITVQTSYKITVNIRLEKVEFFPYLFIIIYNYMRIRIKMWWKYLVPVFLLVTNT